MKHSELVERAKRWLKIQCGGVKGGCGVVVAETGAALGESPDAIGYNGFASYLIECKTSRSDFLADRKKLWRQRPEMGMGCYRYFLCVPDLIKESELPEGWGLLYCHEKRIKVIKKSERFECRDYPLMYSLIRRAVCQGFDPSSRYKDFIKGAQP